MTAELWVTTACYKDSLVYQQHENRELIANVKSLHLKTALAIVPGCQLWPMLVWGQQMWCSWPQLSRVAALMIVSWEDGTDDVLYTAQQLKAGDRQ